jgi:mannose-6-phosphate isomerase-like protein (cupin superfamily)
MPTKHNAEHRTITRPSGGAITILISAKESGGSMSMIETLSPPESGPTYHSHSREDETFYVVSGTAEIRRENRVFRCSVGDHIFGPRNIFHTYRNVEEDPLKLVIVYSSGGFEQSFLDSEEMLQAEKDQNDVAGMLSERYGLTRKPLPI